MFTMNYIVTKFHYQIIIRCILMFNRNKQEIEVINKYMYNYNNIELKKS